jgi:hypothetical protein
VNKAQTLNFSISAPYHQHHSTPNSVTSHNLGNERASRKSKHTKSRASADFKMQDSEHNEVASQSEAAATSLGIENTATQTTTADLLAPTVEAREAAQKSWAWEIEHHGQDMYDDIYRDPVPAVRTGNSNSELFCGIQYYGASPAIMTAIKRKKFGLPFDPTLAHLLPPRQGLGARKPTLARSSAELRDALYPLNMDGQEQEMSQREKSQQESSQQEMSHQDRGDAIRFFYMLETNDCPESYRQAITDQALIAKVMKDTATTITVKGAYWDPFVWKSMPDGHKKLTIEVEGGREVVQIAMRRLKHAVERPSSLEESEASMEENIPLARNIRRPKRKRETEAEIVSREDLEVSKERRMLGMLDDRAAASAANDERTDGGLSTTDGGKTASAELHLAKIRREILETKLELLEAKETEMKLRLATDNEGGHRDI